MTRSSLYICVNARPERSGGDGGDQSERARRGRGRRLWRECCVDLAVEVFEPVRRADARWRAAENLRQGIDATLGSGSLAAMRGTATDVRRHVQPRRRPSIPPERLLEAQILMACTWCGAIGSSASNSTTTCSRWFLDMSADESRRELESALPRRGSRTGAPHQAVRPSSSITQLMSRIRTNQPYRLSRTSLQIAIF